MPDIARHAGKASVALDDATRPGTGRAILVVDDEPAIRRAVAAALRRRGDEVLTAVDGREALRAVYEWSSRPDLVIADMTMPGMGGVELAARLAADRPGVPIVLMTGAPSSAELAREHPDLVAAVLLKPFSMDDLLAVVDRALQGGGRRG